MSDWKSRSLQSLCGVLTGLTALFVTLRFYARRKQKAALLADDGLMVAAFIAFLGCCICTLIGVHYKALGTSTYALSPAEDIIGNRIAHRIQIAINTLSYLSLGCTKASALFFYKRIFDVPGPNSLRFKVIIWSSIAVVAAWVVTFEFLGGFECSTHYSQLWKSTHGDYCLYSYPSIYALVVSDVILDIWVLLLPIPHIVRLRTDLVKRVAIACVFLLALVGLGASITRMVVFIGVKELNLVQTEHMDARRVDSRLVFYWILEMGMSIIAINMPVVWFVFFRAGSSAATHVGRRFAMLRSSSKTTAWAPESEGDSVALKNVETPSSDGAHDMYGARGMVDEDELSYPGRILGHMPAYASANAD